MFSIDWGAPRCAPDHDVHRSVNSISIAACGTQVTDRRDQEVGGVNQRVVTKFQLRMGLTRRFPPPVTVNKVGQPWEPFPAHCEIAAMSEPLTAPQDAILLLEIVDRVALLLMNPGGERHEEKTASETTAEAWAQRQQRHGRPSPSSRDYRTFNRPGADGVTMKLTPLLAWPLTVTTTLPFFAPLGTDTTMLVALQLVGVAAVPLNVIVLVPRVAPKLAPMTVTDVPTGPLVGARLVRLRVVEKGTSTTTSEDRRLVIADVLYACTTKKYRCPSVNATDRLVTFPTSTTVV